MVSNVDKVSPMAMKKDRVVARSRGVRDKGDHARVAVSPLATKVVQPMMRAMMEQMRWVVFMVFIWVCFSK